MRNASPLRAIAATSAAIVATVVARAARAQTSDAEKNEVLRLEAAAGAGVGREESSDHHTLYGFVDGTFFVDITHRLLLGADFTYASFLNPNGLEVSAYSIVGRYEYAHIDRFRFWAQADVGIARATTILAGCGDCYGPDAKAPSAQTSAAFGARIGLDIMLGSVVSFGLQARAMVLDLRGDVSETGTQSGLAPFFLFGPSLALHLSK